jgi:tetratricopeptide (TPR) repeat protein
LKEAGNKAFANKNFEDAVRQYTMAIEITIEKPNHIYFANRANAELELLMWEECIADCNQAIKIEPTFIKSYFRKAKALINQSKLLQAMETLKEGREIDPDSVEIREMIQEVE